MRSTIDSQAGELSPGAGPVASEYRTVQEIVTSYLREAILSGRLEPGARLQQDDLARQLQVSRMPVREALRILESEGLVELPALHASVQHRRRDAAARHRPERRSEAGSPPL